ncbi:MAG: FAD-dependent oxidoreductase [Steroidobacteraceae bacterium]|nr:FAD-dependent oxidoreductase [Steroidobacteraceae bacterium]
MKITRRQLLRLAAASSAAGAWSLASAQPAAIIPGKPRKILIIGAGMSGLVAAYELRKLGHDVTILEAQRRPGGRVWSLRDRFSDGLYVEVGAARIPDNHDLTMRYVREFDLPLTSFAPTAGSRFYSIGGKRIRADTAGEWMAGESALDLKSDEKSLGQWALLEKYVGGALAELGDPYKVDYTSKVARRFDAVTTAQYLRAQGASEGANNLLSWPWATAGDDRISFLWTLREIAYESAEKSRSKIVGGNDKLPYAFAATLKDRIHYGAPVVRLEQDEKRVRAIVKRGASHETFEADRLLCTIPFPALRGIETQPAFSAAKRRAIDELSYDTIVRATLQSRTRYWERDGFNGFGHSDTPQQIWNFTHDQPGPRGLLVSFICGGTGERVGDMEPEARERFLVDEMERAHPGLKQNYEGSFVHVWHKDPWQKGAIALPAPGQMTGICVGAEKPEGRIHFAGEHLSNFSGWIQGALESGLRAVRELA